MLHPPRYCDMFLLFSFGIFFTSKSGRGLAFQEMVMRATNGVLNCPAAKMDGKTVSGHVQHEHSWDDAVVDQNTKNSPTDHNRDVHGASSYFW